VCWGVDEPIVHLTSRLEGQNQLWNEFDLIIKSNVDSIVN